MRKGHSVKQARRLSLSVFGKDLVRRSRSCCELCEVAGVRLNVFEVPPAALEPDVQRCTFLCDHCFEQLQRPKRVDLNHWRCLNKSMWSSAPVVQVLAVAMIYKLKPDVEWADELLEQVYLEPELAEWVEQVEL